MRTDYEIVTRDPVRGTLFSDMMKKGYDHGAPVGGVVHRQGNPGAPALNAIRWGADTGAFSIHWYVDGLRAYSCVPENQHANHVLEWRVADAVGRRVYPGKFAAITPQWLSAPVNGQYSGFSKPRGDVGLIGIETVDHRRADGSIYLDQDTRITTLLLCRDITRRAALRSKRLIKDLIFPWYSHAQLDPWTRPDDPGQALYMIDFQADLLDLIVGREPWRTTGKEYDGRHSNPGLGPYVPAPVTDQTTYTVKPGDTLGRIASEYGVTTTAIQLANNITNPNMIRVGQVLIIPA